MNASRPPVSAFRGLIPPLITPLLPSGALDAEAFDRLIGRLVAAGVNGLFVLGTTGEGPSLPASLKRDVVRHACRSAAGRLPVLVGITDPSADEAAALADWSADCGAAAVVTAPPYYFPLAQDDLLGFLTRLAARLPLPFFLYNIPSHARPAIEPDTVRKAARIPNVLGLKDSSGDLAYFKSLLPITAERPDFTLLMGPEHLLADSMAAGGHGGVCGGANLCPALFVRLCRAAAERDARTTADCQARIASLGRLYEVSPGPAGYLRGLKCALAALGHCRNVFAEPFTPLDVHGERLIRNHLENMPWLLDGQEQS